MSQHTPGPWKLGTSGITIITRAYSFSVGNEHDARLIAKAPEMKALLKVLACVGDNDGPLARVYQADACDKARALLREIEEGDA